MATFHEKAPVYLQIIEKIKGDIVTGKLSGGDKLPSVRELSEQLLVNPNTIQRVFMELEREGVVYSQRGRGTFVTEKQELVMELKSKQAEQYVETFISQMTGLGMTKAEIIGLINQILEG